MAIIHSRPKSSGTIKKPKIGMWATSCCHRDLYKIETQDQIDLILEDWDEGISHDVYNSKLEALMIIREGWDEADEIKMIDKMIDNLE